MKTFTKLSFCVALTFTTSMSVAAPKSSSIEEVGGVCTVNARDVDRALHDRDYTNLRPAIGRDISCFVRSGNPDSGREFPDVAALYAAGYRITHIHVVRMDNAAGAFTQLIIEKR
jgi:hypothetical protein